MKLAYYVNNNPQPNGDHEVHTADCIHLDQIKYKLYLGLFDNCEDAVKKAKTTHAQSNGCAFCASACHTS